MKSSRDLGVSIPNTELQIGHEMLPKGSLKGKGL